MRSNRQMFFRNGFVACFVGWLGVFFMAHEFSGVNTQPLGLTLVILGTLLAVISWELAAAYDRDDDLPSQGS